MEKETAINILREVHDNALFSVRTALETLVPELKESEDERIRKAIVLFFETQDESTTYSFIPKKDILAWLEKQKEFVSTGFKDVWEATDCDKLTAPLEKYSKDAIMRLCHAWYDKGIELERRKGLEKQGEHKSNWSEDDEYNREHLLGWINTLKTYIHHDTLVSIDLRRNKIDEVTKFENWLKSIKDRLNN